MKIIPFTFLLALIWAGHLRAGVEVAQPAEFTVVSATYGLGDQQVDVSLPVRSLVAHEGILLRGPWALGMVDPLPGQIKEVRIVYTVREAAKVATFTQGQDIILPPPPAGLHVVSARYGVGDRQVDVTNEVRTRVANDELEVAPGWMLGAVDPAHGRVKSVTIVYLLKGVPLSAIFTQEEPILLSERTAAKSSD